ncbi:MAG: dihydroorotate dehydrogenase-like protein [Bacteroidales bacterium]|nr:dihydroorotate dehydrogenase-like protein [Bacteroidales bacterium]
MKDLRTSYLGMELKNPIIAGSSGLTGTLDGIVSMEKHGAGAVVLKSIFEEEILLEEKELLKAAKKKPMIYSGLSETLDYLDLHIRENNLGTYLQLIRDAKKAVSIPIIGSINCISTEDWIHFTRKMEEAGANALELNIFLNPADFKNKEFERAYFRIIEKVLTTVTIPVSLKISKYFTRLGLSVKALSETGVAGLVMFNRFYAPDIDIQKMELAKPRLFSSPVEQYETLRWVAILSERVNIHIAASTGIHNGEDLIKMLLAGANAVQVVSTLYKNGPEQIGRMLSRVDQWMTGQGFDSLEQFRGKISRKYGADPAAFERMQFMKHFSEIR